MSIFIVGPMGAGKTTVGKILAKELGADFRDSDAELVSRTGADVGWILEIEGKEGFRNREIQVLEELTKLPNTVIATGAGCVTDPKIRKLLAARGVVIYLDTPLKVQHERVRADESRPLFKKGTDIMAELEKIHKERDVYYREVSDWVISTANMTSKGIVKEILGKVSTI